MNEHNAALMYLKKRVFDVYWRMRGIGASPLDERIFFLHFEKCGGMSLGRAFARQRAMCDLNWRDYSAELAAAASIWAADQQSRSFYAYREELLHYFLSQAGDRDLRYVQGHFQISASILNAYEDEWAFVTLLRDPVERWRSAYLYKRYANLHHNIEGAARDFAEHPGGKTMGQDYVTLLTGRGHDDDETQPATPGSEVVAQAKANLHRFDVVGCLEHLGTFRRDFQERFGVELRIPHRNLNPAPARTQSEPFPPDVQRKIQALCRPNREIYEYARSSF